MVDYLKIQSLVAQRVPRDLAPLQVSHDFIELGDSWTETRKIRIFLNGPSLKGPGDAAYYPDGLGGAPLPPGAPGSDARYDGFWGKQLDSFWARVPKEEFERRFADPEILDRWSPLTSTEEAIVQPAGAIYAHWQTGFDNPRFRLPTDIFDENVAGRVVRRVEIYGDGPALRDNLHIQRRREFSIVYFNGSLSEGEPQTPNFDRTDIAVTRIDAVQFERLYQSATPKLGERDNNE